MSGDRVQQVLGALGAGGDAVDVAGEGALADALRARFGPRAAVAEPPAAIVVTTADADAIADALARVADLGTVILAGPPPEEPVALDLYSDLHVRGLTLLGLPPASEERG